MIVVRVVGEWIDPLRATLGDVVLVGFDCGLIGLRRFVVLADADVHVRWHVNQVPSAGRALRQTRCRWQGAFRFVRGFDQMDVQVIGHRVIGRGFERTFEQRQDFWRPRPGLAGFELVEVPRVQVHQRLCRKNCRVDVIGILRGQLLHRVRVVLVERGPISGGRFGIPRGQRRDVVLLLGAHLGANACARPSASQAWAPASGDIGALMLGPST